MKLDKILKFIVTPILAIFFVYFIIIDDLDYAIMSLIGFVIVLLLRIYIEILERDDR